MNLTFTDDRILGQRTTWVAGRDPDGVWTCTWLPGWALTQNQAVTAMVLAETIAGIDGDPVADEKWVFIRGWGQELGLTEREILAMTEPDPAAESPVTYGDVTGELRHPQ